MSSNAIAISARGLGKSYVIDHKEKYDTAAETFLNTLRHPFRPARRETVWALNDVSFDIARGDIVGVIGRNGAGKSTLLKVLSRITEPSCGEARIWGRVGSLIEVGTGFQPELTGRENIYLNGAILGMRRREITRRFDEIVDFSGVEKFLDTPVKRYSSGMYVRLAFAVAAHLDTDILLVDEVLSVGDAEFQRKSLGKMGDVASSGRTVLFVSHNMATLEALCSTGLLFDSGALVQTGPLKETLAEYHRIVRPYVTGDGGSASLAIDLGPEYRHFRRFDLVDENGLSTRVIPMGGELRLRVLVEADEPIEYPIFVARIDSIMGQRMLSVRSPRNDYAIPRLFGRCELDCHIDQLPFAPGEYSVKIALAKDLVDIESIETELFFTVRNADGFGDGWGASLGLCVARSSWLLSELAPQAV
jgi:homopolymeric O-antigen transport system ATP-binding protein